MSEIQENNTQDFLNMNETQNQNIDSQEVKEYGIWSNQVQ